MKISRGERDHLLENLSLFLSSGTGIAAALESLSNEASSPQGKKLAQTVLNEIDSGSPIWRALEKTQSFPQRTISLIRAGEKSGHLTENLQAAVSQQQKEKLFRSRIYSAMFYPVLVFGVTIVVGLGVSWFLLPRLAQVFGSLNVDLPFLTRVFIGFGEFLNRFGLIAVPITAVVLIGGGFLFFRFWGDLILPFVPGLGRLIKEIELSRFGFILGSLLESGLPISDALDSLEEATSIRPYRRFYSYLSQNIKEGVSFRKSFSFYPKISRLFPLPVRHILSSAEQSGRLSETLLNIGRNYEVRVDDTAKNLTVVLEPILLLVVWFGVLLVALAVILPIYGLIGGLSL
jgi:type II secretory pathway component PulF